MNKKLLALLLLVCMGPVAHANKFTDAMGYFFVGGKNSKGELARGYEGTSRVFAWIMGVSGGLTAVNGGALGIEAAVSKKEKREKIGQLFASYPKAIYNEESRDAIKKAFAAGGNDARLAAQVGIFYVTAGLFSLSTFVWLIARFGPEAYAGLKRACGVDPVKRAEKAEEKAKEALDKDSGNEDLQKAYDKAHKSKLEIKAYEQQFYNRDHVLCQTVQEEIDWINEIRCEKIDEDLTAQKEIADDAEKKEEVRNAAKAKIKELEQEKAALNLDKGDLLALVAKEAWAGAKDDEKDAKQAEWAQAVKDAKLARLEADKAKKEAEYDKLNGVADAEKRDSDAINKAKEALDAAVKVLDEEGAKEAVEFIKSELPKPKKSDD